MTEQRFGIFGKDVTRYIPPELRPFLKAGIDMNPVTGFQRAGQALKEGKYGESALETGILAAAPVAYFGRNLIKPSLTAGVDALKELFLLGAADDVAKKTPAAKQGLSRREVLTGMGAAALAAPVGKGLVDLVPPAPAAKVAKVGLKGALGSAAAKAQKLRDLYFGAMNARRVNEVSPMKAVDSLSQSLKIGEEMDSVTLSMNKDLDKVLKDAGDFSKFSDDELIAMAEMKLDISHMMRTGKGPDDFVRSGDPLRREDVSKALDEAINARGLRKQVRDLGLERMMKSLETKRSSKPRPDMSGINLPSDIIPKMLPSGTTTKQDIDTLFEAMDEEGALLEFPELGKKLNRYTFNNDRDALIEAITDEDYPAYEAAMKGMLKRTFPSGKIPVRRVENYTELQLFGTKDPETLAMMEQAGLQKLKDQKKVVTEKLIDIDDVKFVGNPAEEELIILDTPRQFRKGAMIGDKQLLSYTINLPKKVENLLGGDKPQRFYHGTTREFEDFDPEFKVKTVAGRDFEGSDLKNRGSYYFTSDPESASTFAKSGIDPRTGEPFKSRDPNTGELMTGAVKGSRVIPVYLKKANYFDVDNADHLKTLKQSAFYKENKDKLNEKFKFLGADIDTLIKSGEETVIEEISPELKKLGFEGHTTYLDGNKNIAVYDTDLIVSGVEKKAEGGIAGLSDVARDMFKGPKGIGAYQPFMVG